MELKRQAGCGACGGRLYHEPGCGLDREELVIEALAALRWAYVGAPLYAICPCELGYPGVLGCTHAGAARRLSRSVGRRAAFRAR